MKSIIKFKYILVLIILIFSNIVQASLSSEELKDQIDTEVVEAILSTHQNEINLSDIQLLPKSLKCISENNREFNLENLTVLKNNQYKFKTNANNTSLIIDWSDGDQVHGLLLMLNSLKALNSNKELAFPVKFYDGYWWADGDHYKLIDFICK